MRVGDGFRNKTVAHLPKVSLMMEYLPSSHRIEQIVA